MKNVCRIPIPTKVDPFLSLFASIIKKHKDDGANSPLNVLDMADAEQKYDIAVEANRKAMQLGRDAAAHTQGRNMVLGFLRDQNSYTEETVYHILSSVRTFLLGVLRGDEPRMNKWGFEVSVNKKGGYRVPLPFRKPEALMGLAKKVLEKHTTDGASSPLPVAQTTKLAQLLALATHENEMANNLHNLKEVAFKDRNNAMGWGKKQNSSVPGTLKFYVRAVRNTLLGIYRSRETKLGEWGINVIISPKAKKKD